MFNDWEKPQGVQNLVDIVINPFFIWPVVGFLMVLACLLARYVIKNDIKFSRKSFLIVWLWFFVSEVFKETFIHLYLGYHIAENIPLQFSSLPLYCFLGLAIIKNEFWRDVFKVLAGIFMFFIGLLFWCYPNVINQMVTYGEVIQSITWHFAMVFLGIFNILIYKIYTLKYLKNFLVAILFFVTLIIVGAILNWYLQDIPSMYFYCLPKGPVYPLIDLYWNSTSPFVPYVCIFIVTFVVACFFAFFAVVGFAEVIRLIYSKFSSGKKSAPGDLIA